MNNQFTTTSTPQQQHYSSTITPSHQIASSVILAPPSHQNNGSNYNNNNITNINTMFSYPPHYQQQQQNNSTMNNNNNRFFSFPSFQIPTSTILYPPQSQPTNFNQPPFSLFSNTAHMITTSNDESSSALRKRSNDEISATEDIFNTSNNLLEDTQQCKKVKIESSTSIASLTRTTKWKLGIIPAQVLYQIMSFINRIELIKSVGKVSKHFHRTSRTNLLWRNEDITKLIPSLVSMNALVLFHYQVFGMYNVASPFEQLILYSIDQASLAQFLSIYTNLKKIKIVNRATLINNQLTSCQLKSEALLQICKTCKALIDIDASTLEIEHIEPILTSIADRLEHLNLDHVKSVTFDHVNFLLRNCKNLKTLKCLNTPKFSINNEQLCEIATNSKADKLSTLVVRFLGVDNYENVNLFVKKFKYLKNLHISNWNDVNSLMLTKVLNGLECLEQIKLECNENTIISQPVSINNSNITSISISKLNKLSNLIFGSNSNKKISLLKFESISQLDLPIIEDSELTIETFSIRSSSLNIFQNDKIVTALDRCEKLDILDLQSVTQFNLSSKLLTSVQLFMCDQLTFIKFNNCSKLESVSIDACNQLTELELTQLPKLTELVLFKLPSEGHPILHTLSINCGNDFSNLQISRCVNIRNLNLNCPNLNSLNLTDCKILENINLLGTSNLSKVAISLCVYPNDRMNNLFQFFKNVEYLSISNAAHLTDQVLNEYLSEENASRLQALVLSNCHALVSPHIHNNSIKGLQLLNLNMLENLYIHSNSLAKLFLRNNSQLKNHIQLETYKLKLLQVQNCPQLPSVTMSRSSSTCSSSSSGSCTSGSSGSNYGNTCMNDIIHQAHFDGCPMLNYVIFKSELNGSLDSYKMIIDDYLMKDCPNFNGGFYMSTSNGKMMKMYHHYQTAQVLPMNSQHVPIVLQTNQQANCTNIPSNRPLNPHQQQQQQYYQQQQMRMPPPPKQPILQQQQVPKQQLTLGLVPPPEIVYNQPISEFQQ
ncbi:Hypothetical protein NAEGRDRAFT_68650 [Naegleria gruberi]|uniref:F-box domain-containing protein n=1 Tax=Naegleria gruberi TaxID=5762 RepID=D2VID8_NAEGR|nr:uncharacterized protein NAEGRDRAFT_68650 [Naegleria gruberi]EFC43342.1 Hypothetical protein NAEGRDRAFT_68650 [Naegleria gruberi]|eukprot:XP_002676086.1 Hypothetical protein NAEGRDRAFT_68650 [Naegleria gruberi strain NEG-M]